MPCMPFVGAVESILFGGQYLGPPIHQQVLVSLKLLLLPLQAPCRGHELSLEANLFHWIIRHAEFVIAQAYSSSEGGV